MSFCVAPADSIEFHWFVPCRKGEILQSANGDDANIADLQAQVLAARQRGTEAKSRALEVALSIMEMTKPFEID